MNPNLDAEKNGKEKNTRTWKEFRDSARIAASSITKNVLDHLEVLKKEEEELVDSLRNNKDKSSIQELEEELDVVRYEIVRYNSISEKLASTRKECEKAEIWKVE